MSAPTIVAIMDLERAHRRRVPVTDVKVNDLVEVAGWPAIVKVSEPWSDFVWFLQVHGTYRDKDPFVTDIKFPADIKVYVRRRAT